MIKKIPSFNLIYRSTSSDIPLQSNQGLAQTTHAPVLSNLKRVVSILNYVYCIKQYSNRCELILIGRGQVTDVNVLSSLSNIIAVFYHRAQLYPNSEI